MRIYLDSCIAIYEVETVSPWYTLVDAAIRAHINEDLCYSDMTRLECRTRPLQLGQLSILGDYERFFAQNVRLDIDASVYDLATGLRAGHGMKTPDAIHLATALSHGCEEFWTNDLRLAKATSVLAFRTF